MKRKFLLIVARHWVVRWHRLSAVRSGIVYDPTNYQNALLRYHQLQQHLIQLQKSYAQITNQLNLALQMATSSETCPRVTARCFRNGEM